MVQQKFWVYVIRNEVSGKTYTGITGDLQRRLEEHNTPRLRSKKFTHRHKGHWELIYCETFDNKSEAAKREKFLKTGQGRQFLKARLAQSENRPSN